MGNSTLGLTGGWALLSTGGARLNGAKKDCRSSDDVRLDGLSTTGASCHVRFCNQTDIAEHIVADTGLAAHLGAAAGFVSG